MLTMSTMKYPNIAGGSNMAVSGNGGHVEDVESLFSSSCWQNSSSVPSDFMDTQKLILESSMHGLGSDKMLLDGSLNQDNEITTKTTMDVLDNLLNPNLHELKPLPPFAGYTGHLSINGIQGHHYHALAHRLTEENNNNYTNFNEQNSLVSSSTCNLSTDSLEESGNKQMFGCEDVKVSYADCVNPDSVSGSKLYNECNQPSTQVKTEISEYDIGSIDLSTLIGTAIADPKVVNNVHEGEDASGSRDSWMDLDAWFDEECNDNQKIIINHDGLSEFSMQHSPQNSVEFSKPQMEYSTKNSNQQGSSTLQTLLTHGYMPLLQNRLQNGPPIKQEISNSTNYGMESSTSSPPAVVSTTDNLILSVNGRFINHYNLHGLGDDRMGSPDLLGQNYPHTTTTTPNSTKKSRSRSQKKQHIASSTVYQTEQSLGLLGKEKPVHRCTICNRGFLNKSNIKVHLRTHTGEKPFRCETCAKAFRQKAHLLKHQQIHKRIGRD